MSNFKKSSFMEIIECILRLGVISLLYIFHNRYKMFLTLVFHALARKN